MGNNQGLTSSENTVVQLMKMSIVTLLVIVAAYFLNYIISLLLARWLKADGYGDYSSAVTLINILSVLMLLGRDTAIIRFIPEYISTTEWNSAFGYLKRSFIIITKLGVLIFISGLIIGIILYFLDKTSMFNFDDHHPFFMFIWTVPFIALNTYFGKLLRGFKRIYISAITLNVGRPILLFGIFSVLIMTHTQLSIYGAILAYTLSTVFVLMCQFVVTLFALPSKMINTIPYYDDEDLWKTVAIQLLISGFLSSNLTGIALVITELFDSDEANVGVLSAIFTICSSLWLIYSAVNVVMSPLISPAIRRGDKLALQKLINAGVISMSLVGGILFLMILFFGDIFLGHFGPKFISGYDGLVAISAVFVFALINALSLPILQYSGNQQIIIKIVTIGIILLLVSGAILTHYFHLMGAIIAISLVQIAFSAWSSFQVRKILGVKPLIIY